MVGWGTVQALPPACQAGRAGSPGGATKLLVHSARPIARIVHGMSGGERRADVDSPRQRATHTLSLQHVRLKEQLSTGVLTAIMSIARSPTARCNTPRRQPPTQWDSDYREYSISYRIVMTRAPGIQTTSLKC
jgi:hypothetical protein